MDNIELRDIFAMVAYIATSNKYQSMESASIVRRAYQDADLMMEARKTSKEENIKGAAHDDEIRASAARKIGSFWSEMARNTG